MSTPNNPRAIAAMVGDGYVKAYPATKRQVEVVKAMDVLPRDRRQSVCRMVVAMTMKMLTVEMVCAWTRSSDSYGEFNAWWTALSEADRIKFDVACSAAGMSIAA